METLCWGMGRPRFISRASFFPTICFKEVNSRTFSVPHCLVWIYRPVFYRLLPFGCFPRGRLIFEHPHGRTIILLIILMIKKVRTVKWVSRKTNFFPYEKVKLVNYIWNLSKYCRPFTSQTLKYTYFQYFSKYSLSDLRLWLSPVSIVSKLFQNTNFTFTCFSISILPYCVFNTYAACYMLGVCIVLNLGENTFAYM